ncbi:hypothetical protein GLOTRDRAFT_138229 [Gloeophyllum trabeum ATCC 11539]|uniref:Uncharacterized protein n=1 Tax=Gloeophyllum trabeum (strain ATCC 11539 / FP-39264 / Madison 617) TaxID=670483 RepID=S7QB22_GLOTA|nr:uncharacterized protein GLOTRDRAFT_138229 [Gloeophyllum trabeum ATCC 11539]EPQ56517.1 hypothetical protein GLOTRDRAFT_138229 [Gloeophyllum trabeum ATCC 11539]
MSRSATPALSYTSSCSSTTTLITLASDRSLPLPPPPTTNDLPPAERARLMRSTRKIGALLGTTPHFADADPYTPYPCYPYNHAHSRSASSTSLLPIGPAARLRDEEERARLQEKRRRRQGSVFEVVSGDLASFEVVPRRSVDSVSSASTESKGNGKVKRQPRPLVLCLETRAVEAHGEEDVFSLPCTPTTATVLGESIKISTPLPGATPLSPLSPNHSSSPHSRIPATPHSSRFSTFTSGSPLVFAPVTTPDTPRPHFTKSSSAPMTPLTPRCYSSSSPSPSPKTPSPTLNTRRKKMAKLAKQFGENVPPELVFHSHAQSHSPSHSHSSSQPQATPKPAPAQEKTRRRRSMSVDFAFEVATGTGTVVGKGVAFSGGENWVGEWNRDIRDVQKGLRALRVR